ncbi:hypothetical protein DCO58_02895 [Helicobacter saguini]|uniref:Uncharacterized protein n=1 Tax=Helicobacter saguini TaxID=1548018 RepID=A0A347VS27_9HELI|nr:hypothetical protein [Helicobacter saguini]MWV62677.1 hypothetical protein [Helicobacter saguini]MWV66651.1 hypothetical protein [Helicobacter saguini]MWV69001.1 hypothetical protein [Helicobacter saguini]MWV71445.1 hypothetical protein [Helicobacter saguini]TLD94094.1 hypothetical protein LS64_007200 [Helicobacter saguini]
MPANPLKTIIDGIAEIFGNYKLSKQEAQNYIDKGKSLLEQTKKTLQGYKDNAKISLDSLEKLKEKVELGTLRQYTGLKNRIVESNDKNPPVILSGAAGFAAFSNPFGDMSDKDKEKLLETLDKLAKVTISIAGNVVKNIMETTQNESKELMNKIEKRWGN